MSRGGNNLTFANAGNQTDTWLASTGNHYQYQCRVCADAKVPGRWRDSISVEEAVEMVRANIDAQIVGVDRRLRVEGDELVANYEVTVAIDEHVSRVFVDGSTGEVVVPEVTTDIELVPENICK
jgi:hypothetical protein